MAENHIPIDHICDVLNIKTTTKRVLLLLIEKTDLSVADIATELNIPKSSIYDSLDELIQKSIVVEYSEGRSKTFGVSDLAQLENVYKKQMETLDSAHKSLISYIQENLSKKDQGGVSRPRIKFYYGVEGIRQAFRDTPWVPEHTETYLMWPMKEMVDLLGEEFLIHHGSSRFINKVMMRVVQKNSDKGNVPKSFEWRNHDIEQLFTRIRYAPAHMDWSISYWIYGDKVLFAGSGHEKYAFVVYSREFATLMKLMWQQVWSIAEV
jgi:HTH-type transcriptional regulator, sugar sensing transcriptional regulator